MPEGGKIMVKASNVDLTSRDNLPLEKGKYVKIEIRDEGEGIPEENLSKIFDPYFSTRKDGSGLGLAIAYSIMKKHGGHITVLSKVGIGSTFTIYIPAAPVSKTLASKNDERKTNGNHQRIKILVMDDQKYVRNTIKTMLSLHNYEVVTAENGYQVIELYRKALMNEKPFDVVLLDLTVPGGYGGKETLRELLKIDPAVRAVALSGYSNDPAMAVYRVYGFKASISKPFDIDELLKTIETVMDNTTVHEEQKN
jgi:CheY-like chemotaxis protein